VSTGTGQSTPPNVADSALENLEAGIALFYENKVAEARARFEDVVAGGDESRFVIRAKDYLAACERAATAAEGDTDDAFLEAVMARNDGDLERVLELCGDDGRDDDDRFVYLAACVHALMGDQEAALDRLTQAVELDRKNRVRAFHDGDFSSLDEDERFVKLVHELND
jgi:tetratricopeptide (TPR) repeat protein